MREEKRHPRTCEGNGLAVPLPAPASPESDLECDLVGGCPKCDELPSLEFGWRLCSKEESLLLLDVVEALSAASA